MRKYYLLAITCFIFFTNCAAYSKSSNSETFSKIEKNLFGIEYANQNDTKRLERIEQAVYGEASKGDLKIRITKLNKDLSAEMFGQEIKPKKDTFDEEEYSYEEKADANVNYPIIDELENKLFKKTYKNYAISKRLENIEKKAFNKDYNNEDLNSRTERLKKALLPNKNTFSPEDIIALAKKDILNFNNKNENYTEEYNEKEEYSESYTNNEELNIPLAQLEKKILRHTYLNDSMPTRLVRLESKLFNTTFTQDDTQTRIDRISSAYQASKTSRRYDDNKFVQHLDVAMQVGAFILMLLVTIL